MTRDPRDSETNDESNLSCKLTLNCINVKVDFGGISWIDMIVSSHINNEMCSIKIMKKKRLNAKA